MSAPGGVAPRGEALRRAVRWLAEAGRHDEAAVAEAALRFDLSPGDAEFLRRHFGPGAGARAGDPARD